MPSVETFCPVKTKMLSWESPNERGVLDTVLLAKIDCYSVLLLDWFAFTHTHTDRLRYKRTFNIHKHNSKL